MFSYAIPPVKTPACPVISKLALSFPASKPVEAAVHCLKFPGDNSIIAYSRRVWVLCLDGRFWLGPAHLLKHAIIHLA